MAYRFTKKADKPGKDFRITIPGEHWEALDVIAKAECAEPADVIRDMIAHCVKSFGRGRSAKVKSLVEQECQSL